MTNTLAIAERELRSYFVSWVAYAIAAAFLVITGFLFTAIVQQTREASLRPLLGNLSVLFLFITPALTMRLLAEEHRTGTIELLLTSPVRETELVVGKFLGSLGFLVAILIATLYYPFLLYVFGGNPDHGPILTGYLGVLLQGASFLAVGLLASSLTGNQAVAAVVAFAALLFLWLIDFLGNLMPGTAGEIVRYLSVNRHVTDFSRGVIDTKDVVFYLSLIVACLFLAVRSVESRRWR